MPNFAELHEIKKKMQMLFETIKMQVEKNNISKKQLEKFNNLITDEKKLKEILQFLDYM